jgi:hypothetical protein
MSLLSHTSKSNTDCIKKIIIEALKTKRNKLQTVMMALSKFLVLLALFLLASHANAFTSLSPVAESQDQENHLI